MNKGKWLILLLVCRPVFAQVPAGADKNDREATAWYEKALELSKTGQLDSAILLYKKSITAFKQNRNFDYLVKAYGNLAFTLHKKGMDNSVQAYSDSAYTLLDSVNDNLRMRAALLTNMARVQDLLGNKPGAKKRYREILEMLKDTTLHDIRSVVYMNLAKLYANDYYLDIANLDTAVQMGKMAVESALLANDSLTHARAQLFYGSTLVFRGKEVQNGLDQLETALVYFQKVGDTYNRTYVLLQIAKAYLLQENHTKAIAISERGIQVAEEHGYGIHLLGVLDVKRRAEEKLGDYQSSLKTYKAYVGIKDSIEAVNLKNELAEMEVQYQVREKENQLKLLKAENSLAKEEKQRLYLLASALLILLPGVTGFFVYRARVRKKVLRQKELHFRTLRRTEQLEKEKLQMKIDFRSRQLFTQALQLSERNQLLEHFLKELNKTPVEKSRQLINSLRSQLKQSISTDSHWTDFKKKFEEVHPAFFERLHQMDIPLTENERRLLAFAKLQLNNKEVAHILHIAPDSVKMARYRLKKRLNLPEDMTLEQFVQSI